MSRLIFLCLLLFGGASAFAFVGFLNQAGVSKETLNFVNSHKDWLDKDMYGKIPGITNATRRNEITQFWANATARKDDITGVDELYKETATMTATILGQKVLINGRKELMDFYHSEKKRGVMSAKLPIVSATYTYPLKQVLVKGKLDLTKKDGKHEYGVYEYLVTDDGSAGLIDYENAEIKL